MLARSLLVAGLLQTRTHPGARCYRPLKKSLACCLFAVKGQRAYFSAAIAHPAVYSMAHIEALPPAPVLQRDLFNESLQLKALRIPKKECQKYMKLLEGCGRKLYPKCAPHSRDDSAALTHLCSCRYTFEKPRLRCILPDKAGADTRLLLLAETVHERGAFTAFNPQ